MESKTGKSVSVEPSRATEPIILLRESGSSIFKEGEIEGSLPKDSASASYPGQVQFIRIADVSYSLETSGSVTFKAGNGLVLEDFTLTLSQRDMRQQLMKQMGAGSEFPQRLLWSGDIDRDGKPDLLMDLSRHYNETRRVLFLSSWAKEPDLVKGVAEFVTTGC